MTTIISLRTEPESTSHRWYFFSACSVIASCDHLGEMCNYIFKDSKAAQNIMHRTKCSEIIKNIL